MLKTEKADDFDKQPIIIDAGSHTIRMGFAGDDVPRLVMDSAVCRSGSVCNFFQKKKSKKKTFELRLNGFDIMVVQNVYFGHEAMKRRFKCELQRPISADRQGSDLEHLRDLWEHGILSELNCLPSFHNLLPTIKFVTSDMKKYCEDLCQMAFEDFGTPAFYLANDNVLSLYSSGRTTGLVVDMGNEYSTLAPIYEGT
jgi:actin-related protein